MSSRRITKSHSENLSNQSKVNGIGHKRNLMKQEEIDLSNENHCDKDRTVRSAHSISICINTFDEISSEDNMRQDLLHDVDQVSEIDNLENGVNKITIHDEDLSQSADVLILPISDQCDSKDKKRTKHLVRCEAVRESSVSPPPPSNADGNQVNANKTQSFNTNHLTVYSNNKSVTIIKNSSSLKSSNSQSNSATSSPSLSRDSSTDNNLEYTSAELQVFLIDTLKRNQKDRMFLYRVESEVLQLIKDSSKESHKFTPTTSYNRLLIHRVAAYFGLEHNVDHTHTSVIVTKTKNTQIPEKKLKELIKDDDSSDEPKKCILKRDSTSLEDSSGSSFDKDKSPESHLNGSFSDSSRSRSLEEREENYERVRARIFNNSTNNKGASNEETPKSTNDNGGTGSPVKVVENELKPPSEEATELKPESSPENESHSDCDKPKEALLPNKPAPITTTSNSTATSQAKNHNQEAKKGSSHNNRFDGSNRNKFNHRNKGASFSDQNSSRFQHNRRGEPMANRSNDNEWSLKPNLNAKLPSQNMPYNLLYPNCVDGHFVPRFPQALNPHAPSGNQFPLGHHHPYMQPPLLSNEQLFPQVNFMNSPMFSNQANVPNSMLNAINYNSNGVNSTCAPNNLSMPNGYQFVYGNLPLGGHNGVPYSPPPNLAQAPNFNSLMGLPYHHQYTQGLPVNGLLQMPPNFKPPAMNEFDKGQVRNANFAKPQMPPLLNFLPPGQYPYPPEVLDRNMASVQFGTSLLPNDLAINNRGAMHNAPFPLNFPNVNKRHANEVLLNNPNLPPQAPATMYLNQQKAFFANQAKQNPLNKYPNSNNTTTNNNNNNSRNRRGQNHPNPNPHRKY